jgi:hypothetical protein
VPDEVLDDLRARLHRTRWPEAELVDDWSQGDPLAHLPVRYRRDQSIVAVVGSSGR